MSNKAEYVPHPQYGEHLNNFAIIRTSGRAENIKNGSTYFSVLEDVHREFQGAGGNWDRPHLLLHNGKIVAENLASLAWEYGEALSKARNAAWQGVQSARYPEWLAEFDGIARKN